MPDVFLLNDLMCFYTVTANLCV